MKQEKAIARLFSGKKAFTLMLAVLLVLGCSVGATLAYLTATTNEVKNTFTVGKVAITLDEHVYDPTTNTLKTENEETEAKEEELVGANGTNTYKLIPGKNMPKDPFVTVKAGSEKCWLFVRIDEANLALNSTENAVKYSLDDDAWNTLTLSGYADGVRVYYRIVDANASDQKLYVLGKDGLCTDDTHGNGCVTINADITSSFQSTPVLKFTAAAIQYDGLEVVNGGEEGVDYDLTAAQAAFDKLPTDFTTTENLNTPKTAE